MSTKPVVRYGRIFVTLSRLHLLRQLHTFRPFARPVPGHVSIIVRPPKYQQLGNSQPCASPHTFNFFNFYKLHLNLQFLLILTRLRVCSLSLSSTSHTARLVETRREAHAAPFVAAASNSFYFMRTGIWAIPGATKRKPLGISLTNKFSFSSLR